MARPVPAVTRITGVLTFLAQHPTESFTLSELCRELQQSPATAHALLNALVDEGFLLREPVGRTYSLGPALVGIGSAAAARQGNVIEFARGELKALAAELGRQCVVTQVIGQRIVLAAREGPASPLGATMEIGKRLPFQPPLGTVFLAWSSKEEIEDWLRGISPDTGSRAIHKCLRAMQSVRELGYSVSLDVLPHRSLSARGGLAHLLNNNYFPDAIEPRTVYPVTQIAAPVFDATGRVVLAVSCPYLGERISGDRIRRDARRIVAAADRVTDTIHGRKPAAVADEHG